MGEIEELRKRSEGLISQVEKLDSWDLAQSLYHDVEMALKNLENYLKGKAT